MFDEPRIEVRPAQPYVAVEASIAMGGFDVVGGLFAGLFGWLGDHGVSPAGPPFIRYVVIDMENLLEIEVAVPVTESVSVDEHVLSAVLPAGPYVTLRYRASTEEEHIAAHAHLQQWVHDHGLRWKNHVEGDREIWGGRIEISPEPGTSDDESFIAYLVEE